MGSLYSPGFALVTTVGMLLVFWVGQRLFAPSYAFRRDAAPPKLDDAPVPEGGTLAGDGHDNVARALLLSGDVVGIGLISASVVSASVQGESFVRDATWVACFGTVGLFAYVLSARLGVRALLHSRLTAEVVRGNVAAGIAAGAHSVATGLIVARAVGGTDLRSLGISLAFFALAQLSLHAIVALFRFVTTYDDAEEIAGENVAAALSYAGITIGVAIVIGHAVDGQFTGWIPSLKGYALALLYAVLFFPVRQLVVQTLLLGLPFGKGALDEAIGRKRNIGYGALEGFSYIAIALVVANLA